jgi:Ni,Fe-hydrogenase III large subunit
MTWATPRLGFIALWTDATTAYALYHPGEIVTTPITDNAYPALPHPGAAWFQRLAHDLNGHAATGAADTRPAIEHFRSPDGTAPWPDVMFPAIEGAHQAAVGPVHAAIIEPAHFRFHLIGEKILSVQARLGYSHKGTLGLMRNKTPRLAARFAARISGDSTVAHSLAFAHAAEAACQTPAPPRATHLRAVMAELERIANHVSDIGAVAGDAGFAFLDARLSAHRESLCAAASAAFGHRLMMDIVIPGGIARDIVGPTPILTALETLESELPSLIRVLETYASLQDRLVGTGLIPPDLAAAYNAGGYVGRASGHANDARLSPGYPPYTEFGFETPLESAGDVAARCRIRLAEITESIRLIRDILANLPDSPLSRPLPAVTATGLGVAESFRGPAWHWLTLVDGTITDIFIADPSTLHWPLLEHAATTGILADFPLINKSINPSYSGTDL